MIILRASQGRFHLASKKCTGNEKTVNIDDGLHVSGLNNYVK